MHHLLREASCTLATAESLTGGRLASALAAAPGSSQVFRGGVVAYATEVKIAVLGVPAGLVEAHGVVSAECAAAMARRARKITGATYALSTTGVAGPAEQEGKPPGTVFVGLAGPDGEHTLALELSGRREQVIERTCEEALALLIAAAEEPRLR